MLNEAKSLTKHDIYITACKLKSRCQELDRFALLILWTQLYMSTQQSACWKCHTISFGTSQCLCSTGNKQSIELMTQSVTALTQGLSYAKRHGFEPLYFLLTVQMLRVHIWKCIILYTLLNHTGPPPPPSLLSNTRFVKIFFCKIKSCYCCFFYQNRG